MPYKVTLSPPGVRGDAPRRAIALTYAGPAVNGKPGPRIPMPAAAVAALQAAYTLIEAQFRVDAADTDAKISLSSAQDQIRIDPAFPLPDDTVGPALVFVFSKAMTQTVYDELVFDVQFSGPNAGPDTWISGNWSIQQDVTRTAADAP